MPHSEPTRYRTPFEEPTGTPGVDGPREALGHLDVPVIGALDAELGLGAPIRLEVDREGMTLQPGSGLVVHAQDLPTVELRRVRLDLVYGVVHTDSDALGPFFDRTLTVALCSALRHTIGWEPGKSLVDVGAKRFASGRGGERHVWTRRLFPAATLGVHPDTRLLLELRGDALELTVSRPMLLRVIGFSFQFITIRYLFGAARLEIQPGTLGPLRRGLMRLAAWFLTRWLRRRLPAAMTAPGYDLFADEARRAHVLDLVRRVRKQERDAEERGSQDMSQGAGSSPHELARAGSKGGASLFSPVKAAAFAALQTLRVSADDAPEITRTLIKLPLGPFSAIALCTDRGGDVVLTKHPGGARLEAPKGLYLFTDQFPELAELRVTRVHVGLQHPGGVGFDLQTEPALGSFMRALLQRVSGEHLVPRVPVDRLRAGGVFQEPGAEHHTLWRQTLGGDRELALRTAAGAEVRVRFGEEALVIEAPAGLQAMFPGVDVLPAADLRRISYRWSDGAIETDGQPALGEFGQALLTQLARVHVAPHAPKHLNLPDAGAPELDPALARDFPAALVDLKLPVLGALQLRMDPADTLAWDLGPATLSAHSGRGLVLAAPDLGLALQIRSVRYALPERALQVEASPPLGDYVTALASLAIEAFLLPLLRKAVTLWPDARPDAPWDPLAAQPRSRVAELLGLSLKLSLPPGASLTARRAPDAIELGATAPLQVLPDGSPFLPDLAIERVRWAPAGKRVEFVTQPPAGPLLHELARRFYARFTPDIVIRKLAEQLALPEATDGPPPRPAPSAPPLIELSLPLVDALCLVADSANTLDLALDRRTARVRFGQGLVVRLPEVGVHLAVRGADVEFLPFTVTLDTDPVAGELENHLASHAVRGMFAQVMKLFWPSDHTQRVGHDVLLSFGGGQPWGPVELCVPHGGELAVHLDHEGLSLRSVAGLHVSGKSLGWLPDFSVHEFGYRFDDGAVQMRISGISEQYYREAAPVSPITESLVAHLLRVLVRPHLPAWTQRLGLRLLPPAPLPPIDPTHVPVLKAQMPGGYAQVIASMDPRDLFEIRADRNEIVVQSARGLQIDVPGLHLRVEFRGARYHMQSGEVQIGNLGQLENALAEAVVQRVLESYEPSAADGDAAGLVAVLDRFPVDDKGRRRLVDSKLADVTLDPATVLVVRLDEEGLTITADPPIKIDGPAVMNFAFGGLRYGFEKAAFEFDLARDGVLAGAFSGLINSEIENQLNSLLRPILPRAMRTPGYSLATDPDPSATIGALLRIVGLSGRFFGPA